MSSAFPLDDAGRRREDWAARGEAVKMANNVRKLRVALLLTPSQLAWRMRADATDVERIEAPGYELTPDWIAAVARTLGVPAAAVTDPEIDIEAIKSAAAVRSEAPPVCPVATRYALLATVAKFAGVKFANSIDDDSIARAVQIFFEFVENNEEAASAEDPTRQTLGLRIAVLAILQARGFDPGRRFEAELQHALEGSMAMMNRFAKIGREPEK